MFTTIVVLFFIKYFKKRSEMILKFKKALRRILCSITRHQFKRYYTNNEKVDIICEKCEKHIQQNVSNKLINIDYFE